MNLEEMRIIVRRDLHDTDETDYRWSDDELNRHISHAVKDFSEACPREQKSLLATTTGSRVIDISTLTDRVSVEAVEYPEGLTLASFQRFTLWGDTMALLGDVIPDGANAAIYYGALHVLDTMTSTIPEWQEELIATGAGGYAALEWAVYATNRVNIGGSQTAVEMQNWGREKLADFRRELKRLHRKNRVRVRALYVPGTIAVNRATDSGP